MFRRYLVAAAIGFPLMVGGLAFAQTSDLPKPPDMQALMGMSNEDMIKTMEEFRTKMKGLTPEQREQMRAQRKARMEAMSPEERKAMHEKMQQRLQSMTPEQREKFKSLMPHHNKNAGGAANRPGFGSNGAGGALPPPSIGQDGPPPATPSIGAPQPPTEMQE